MTTSDRLRRLFKLAELAQEFDTLVDFKLSDAWSELREEFGLAKLLLIIKEHVRKTTPDKVQPPAHQATQSNQNAAPL